MRMPLEMEAVRTPSLGLGFGDGDQAVEEFPKQYSVDKIKHGDYQC